MDLIKEQFINIKKDNRIGLMTHVIVGYPDLEMTEKIVLEMIKNGADFVELQIPFSDPIADGPTIMAACEKSLGNGTRVKDGFKLMEKLSQKTDVPLFFMAYYNTIFKYGTEKFCIDAKKAGASGVIVPDMPVDEEGDEHFYKYCRKYNLANIQVLSPSSTTDRIIKNVKKARGFIYFTARQGTTGAKDTLNTNIKEKVENIRKYTKLPIAAGFGISTREQVSSLQNISDIAVIGSAIIDIINKSDKNDILKNTGSFIKNIRTA